MKTRDAESVLVTGASGFIGQHLVRRLIERGDRVSCLVRATSRIDELRSSGARLIVGDATDRAGMERALAESQADVVFHPAGLLKAVRTADFAHVNAGGVESVAAACADRRDVLGPDIPGPIGRKEKDYAADSCGNRSGCRRCTPVAD